MEVLLNICGCPRVGFLLLIYIFILKAAADCPKPEGRGNIVLTDAALLINEFPDGTHITLECANGYVKENGSEIITCIHGQWSEPDLTCKKKDCGPPEPQPHISFDISGGTLFGDSIKAICDKGYRIRGPSYKTCYSRGWTGKPRCEIVMCEKPAEVTNGRSSWDSQDDPKYGESIHYSCNEGYTLVGKATIQCSETGVYDSDPPECKEESTSTDLSATTTAHRDETSSTPTVSPSARVVMCEKPAEVTNGRSSWDSQDDPKYGESIHYSCNEGYTLVGKATIQCSETGVYDSDPPECKEESTSTDLSATTTAHRDETSSTPTVSPSARADCPKPEGRGNIVLTDAALLINEFPDGIHITLECANGYVKENGSEIITCIHGQWSEPDLTCKKKDCGPPEPQPHISFDISGGTLFGDSIKAICDKGYRIRGPSYKTCYSRGWTGKPRCEIVMCEKPAEVTNGRSSWDSQDDPKYGESIHYSCNEGYTLVGKATIQCSETGVYDSDPPECKEESTSTNLSATTTAHRDETSSTPTVSPSARGLTTEDMITNKMVTHPTPTPPIQGGRDVTAGNKDKSATASVISSIPSFQADQTDEAVDITKNNGYTAVIISVVVVSLVACVVVAFIYRILLRRKGSYDTNEDLKPELLQFQNL